MSIFY